MWNPLARLEGLLHDVAQGGMTVDTPPSGNPVLRSVIQFDGDVQTMICATAIDGLAAQPALLEQHQAAMARRVDSLRGLRIVGRVLGYSAWTVSFGGSLLSASVTWQNAAALLWRMVPFLLLAIIRLAFPYLLRWSLSAAMRRVAKSLHDDGEEEANRLRKTRADRQRAPD